MNLTAPGKMRMMYIAPQECQDLLISWGTVLQQGSKYSKSTTVLSEDIVCFTLKIERRRAGTWLESGVRVFFVLFLWFGFFPLRSYVVGTYL